MLARMGLGEDVPNGAQGLVQAGAEGLGEAGAGAPGLWLGVMRKGR